MDVNHPGYADDELGIITYSRDRGASAYGAGL